MMQEEFSALTGFYPTPTHYDEIERRYMDFDGDKRAFCEAYRSNRDGIAAATAQVAFMTDLGEKHLLTKRIEEKNKEIQRLKEQLEREQEWKPYECAYNVKQAEYEQLVKCGRYMTDEEALDWVVQEAGFARERISIIHELPEEEINRHRQIRKTGKMIDRRPVYDATDYHYVRFNVKACLTRGYELWNDELRPYWD